MRPDVRRYVLGAFACSLVALGAPNAASAEPPQVLLKGGWSQAQFGGFLGEAFNEDLGSGAGGIAVSHRVRPWLSIQPELLWQRKGGAYTTQFVTTGFPEQAASTMSVRYTLDYIELPVLAKFAPGAESFFRPHLIAGVAPAFRFGGDSKTSFPDQPMLSASGMRFARIFENLAAIAGPDNFERFDMGLIAGGGFSFGSGRWSVELEGRYQHGFVDVLPAGAEVDGFNRSMLFTMGIRVQ